MCTLEENNGNIMSTGVGEKERTESRAVLSFRDYQLEFSKKSMAV